VKGGEEEADGLGEVGKGEVVVSRGGGEAEAREIRGEDVVGWGEEADEVAELVAGGGETVQEEEKGIGTRSSFGVGKVRAVRDCEIVVGRRMQSHGYGRLLYVSQRWGARRPRHAIEVSRVVLCHIVRRHLPFECMQGVP